MSYKEVAMPVISRFYGIVITMYLRIITLLIAMLNMEATRPLLTLMETFWRVTYPAEHLGLYKNGLRRTIWN